MTKVDPLPTIIPSFFCSYCRAKFSYGDLRRVMAHLKPHASEQEAELRAAAPVLGTESL